MAHRATTWAWEVDGLSIPQKFLLVALADMADEAFSCFPGQATLARMTGAGKRSVVNNLAELERLGFIVRERRSRSDGSRTSDRFLLQVGFRPGLSASDAPGAMVHEMQGLSASDDVSKMHLTTSQGAPGALEENPQRNHQTESPDTPVVPAADPVLEALDRVWSAWPSARRGARKKVDSSWRTAVVTVGRGRLEQLVSKALDFCDVWRTWAPSEIQYVPLLTTWLNQERWTTPLPERGKGHRPGTVETGRAADQLLRERAGQKAIAS